jgi:NifB/MoaA-like Fe-S oxidoreductase
MNDGIYLDETIRDLAGHYPNVLSIGVVPVGLTRTPQEILSGPDPSCSRILPSAADLPLRTFLPDEAQAVVRQVRSHQREFRRDDGCNVVYASDEFYLLCGVPVPSAASYDGYPQFENGIGMVRDLIDDWKRLKRRIAGRQRPASLRATLVCAEMIGHTLAGLVREWQEVCGANAEVAVIPNSFFGPRVRVSGLLTGGDVVAKAERYSGGVLILPSVMLDKTGSRCIDGMTPDQISQAVSRPVKFAAYLSEVDRIVFDSERSAAA